MHSGEPTRLQCHKALGGGKKERAQDSLSASRTRSHICNEGFHKNDLAKRAEKPLNPNAFVSQGGKKKHPTGLYQILSDVMAGAVGFEPTTKVLETHVLPLHHAPKHLFSIA